MSKTAKEKDAVVNLFAAMLRPLMRVAFEYGIGANDIARIVKRTYIQSLEARLAEQKRPTTEARLALIASLPHSEVASLRDASVHSSNSGVSPERIGNVLTMWHTDQRFAGAYGIPLDLDIAPVQGSARMSFAALVEAACPDGADAEVLLDALVAAKSVEVVDGTARIVSRAYVTSSPDVSRIETVGRFIEFVISTFAYNLLQGGAEPLYFENAVVSDARLSDAGRDQLLAISRKRGQELLFELDTFITQMDESKRSESGRRYRLGMYFFEDPTGERSSGLNADLRSNRDAREAAEKAPQEIDVLAALSGQKN